MNVFDFAMEMEDAGYKYYQKLADSATQPALKTIFTSLANDERKHFEIFKSLKEGRKGQTMPESDALVTAKNLFTSLSGDAADIQDVTETLEAYQHAMKIENKSFKFYEDAAAKESDAGTKELLLQIANEELKHFDILENVYNFVNAPNQNLEWGEFSNLGEFRQFGRDTDS